MILSHKKEEEEKKKKLRIIYKDSAVEEHVLRDKKKKKKFEVQIEKNRKYGKNGCRSINLFFLILKENHSGTIDKMKFCRDISQRV